MNLYGAGYSVGQVVPPLSLKDQFGHTTAKWEELFANNGQKFIQIYAQRFPQAFPLLTNPAMLDGILSVGTFAKEYSSDGGNIVE